MATMLNTFFPLESCSYSHQRLSQFIDQNFFFSNALGLIKQEKCLLSYFQSSGVVRSPDIQIKKKLEYDSKLENETSRSDDPIVKKSKWRIKLKDLI